MFRCRECHSLQQCWSWTWTQLMLLLLLPTYSTSPVRWPSSESTTALLVHTRTHVESSQLNDVPDEIDCLDCLHFMTVKGFIITESTFISSNRIPGRSVYLVILTVFNIVGKYIKYFLLDFFLGFFFFFYISSFSEGST